MCKVALSLAQAAPRAKYNYLAPKAMTLVAMPLDTGQTWIAHWSLSFLSGDHAQVVIRRIRTVLRYRPNGVDPPAPCE
jgi:hypothetical protein